MCVIDKERSTSWSSMYELYSILSISTSQKHSISRYKWRGALPALLYVANMNHVPVTDIRGAMPPAFPVHGDVAAVAGPPISWPRAKVEQPSKACASQWQDEEMRVWWEAPTFQNIDSWISILKGFMIQFNLSKYWQRSNIFQNHEAQGWKPRSPRFFLKVLMAGRPWNWLYSFLLIVEGFLLSISMFGNKMDDGSCVSDWGVAQPFCTDPQVAHIIWWKVLPSGIAVDYVNVGNSLIWSHINNEGWLISPFKKRLSSTCSVWQSGKSGNTESSENPQWTKKNKLHQKTRWT